MRERRRRKRSRVRDRKDRLIQTRVAEDLEQRLKDEAAKRRLTVSHLIRNTLEDAFNLVEDVTNDVEQLVTGSVELAAAVSRDARRFASIVRGRPVDEKPQNSPGIDAEPEEITARGSAGPPSAPVPPPTSNASEAANDSVQAESDPLGHIYGWNRVVANRGAACARCRSGIERGDEAMVGLSDDPQKPRAWLCSACAEEL